MIIKVLIPALAVGLVSSAALAQERYNDPQSANAPTTVNPPLYETQAPVGVATDVVVVAMNADEARARGIPVELVASAPVPDTPANRRAYGQPMSNAGKNTTPAGN